MTLKACTCCQELVTTKNAKRVIRMAIGHDKDCLWFNCPHCNSTLVKTLRKGMKNEKENTAKI